MKRLLITVLSALVLAGCSTARYVPQVVTRVQRDTLYLNRIQYDSIYVDNWQLTDRSRDTIYVEKIRLEYKYKLLRDTCYVHQIDSIPVIKTVEVVKTERYTPWIYRASLWAVIIIIVCLILFVLWKFLKARLKVFES